MRRSARELADALDKSARALLESAARKVATAEGCEGAPADLLRCDARADAASAELMTEAAWCIRRLDGYKREHGGTK